MKVIKPQKLGLLTRCFEQARRPYLGISALCLHRFSHAMASEAEMWSFLAEELGKDGVPDEGMPKCRGEFLVTGPACHPQGREGTTLDVRVRVGEIEKRLRVTGDRYWRRQDLATDPLPFVEMPIDWEHAFGGEGFARNPLGKGVGVVELEQGPAHPLPNVEGIDGLVRGVRDRPDPVSLGPLDVTWPQRARKAGTYDADWLERLSPGFAHDMDWSIFNIAPEDQQQPTAFRGDESFEIEGMNPDRPRQEGTLPGTRTRCFLNLERGGTTEFREVEMNLTTVWIFPRAERVLMVFHGWQEVAEEDASDVSQILIGAELMGEAKAEDHYRGVLERHLDPDDGPLQALRDGDLLPSSAEITAGADQNTEEMKALLQTENLLEQRVRERTNREIEERRAFIAGLGLDPDIHGPSPLPAPDPPPDPEDVPALIAKAEAEAEEERQAQEERDAVQEAELRQLLEREGIDADAFIARIRRPPQGPPTFSAEAEIASMAELAAAYRARGMPIEELDRYATDPERRQLLVETETMVRDGYRQAAHRQEPAHRFTGDDARRSRAAALATLRDRGSLAGQNLTGFDLSAADLRGVDLRGAWLENANLAGANMQGADLSEAVLARANLTDANLEEATLVGTNLGLAEIVRTRLDAARMSDAILRGARLQDASLRRAELDSVDLLEAHFTDVDFHQAKLVDLLLMETSLSGLRLHEADLGGSTLIEVNLDGADFSRARLEKVTFLKSSGERTIFAGADLSGAVFAQGCDFSRADFRRAILAPTNLRGTKLEDADFSAANLTGADLSECNLRRARLDGASARGCLFIKSLLVDASARTVDLMDAIFQSADLSGAHLQGSNLFQSDFSRVLIDEHTNFDDTNRKRMRIQPTRTAS